MKFELFSKLYLEALEYSDIDMYIAERGWQDWMNDFENHGDILERIYELAYMSIREIRESNGLSRAAFSRAYNIPIRTLETWDANISKTPVYVETLIAYTFFGVD